MKLARRLAALALALAAVPAFASPWLSGSTVTGRVSGATDQMLGAADGYATAAGPAVTPVSGVAGDIEFLSGDFALAFDFDEAGGLAIQDNTGGLLLAGTYVFDFSFDGLLGPIGAFEAADLSALLAGSLAFERVDARSVRLTATDLQFAEPFAVAGARLLVPEPGSGALLAAALLAWAFTRRAARGER